MSIDTILETEEMQQCYSTIVDFFSAWGLEPSKKYLYKILRSAMDKKATRLNPSNVLYYFKTLNSLIVVALRIHSRGYQREKAIIEATESGVPDLTQYKDYFGWHPADFIWNFAPRALSPKEYFNPYKVFEKIARFGDENEWSGLLNELQDFTFYRSSFAECGEEHNVLVIHRVLLKLIEAAYLIDVRAIDEVDGTLRRKWKEKEGTNSNP
jgi:hypothetical protein